ncbi:adenylate/guanylate cyclase domain-containing protein [soil metagenome]
MERRLAAILAADIVGYSRLMEQDEPGTMQALTAWRVSILEPTAARHHGRIVKLMGDGVLMEFASPVEAVQCALEIREKTGAEQAFQLRIGINLGDVMVDAGDIFGDGVNIAARLQAMAEPGGILIARNVHDQVERKLALAYRDLGPLTMKNIERPVHAFAIEAGARREGASGNTGAGPNPSIAVLPFTNMSGDADQQYFSDGMTEDIITELARFREIRVIARNSSFRYRGGDADMIKTGRELNARYLVEGSVRKLGGRIRITAQLIDAVTGHHLWAERYDRALEDLFAVQDEVVRTIVATVIGRLRADGVEGVARKAPASFTAYDYVLRADALPFSDPASWESGRILYEKAIALDPGYARAYALLSNLLRLGWEENMDGFETKLEQAYEYARKAVELDPNDPLSHRVMGAVYLNRRAFDLAETHYRKAIAMNPNSSVTMASSGFLFSYVGHADEAVERIKEAKRIDPFFEPSWYWSSLGVAHFAARQYEEAIVALNRSHARPYWMYAYLAASHAQAGRLDEAQRCGAETLRMRPDFTILRFAGNEPYKFAADRDNLIEGLRKAGLPD